MPSRLNVYVGFCQSKIDHVDEGARHSESANQAVFRFDVAVNKVDRMDVLYPVKELRSISQYPKKYPAVLNHDLFFFFFSP